MLMIKLHGFNSLHSSFSEKFKNIFININHNFNWDKVEILDKREIIAS